MDEGSGDMIRQVMRATQSVDSLAVRDLGRMAYAPCLELQRQINQAVASEAQSPTLLLVEHDPVITLTPRRGVAEHLLASRERLTQLGIDVQPTDRGGDITYHGPGQLVVYPILRLGPLGLNLGRYMRLLEQIAIDTAGAFGIEGRRDAGMTGVWVVSPPEIRNPTTSTVPRDAASEMAKLCAMGVRIRKNTTMHGLAFNVAPDLSHFQTIVPCGLVDRPVTSLQELLGEDCPSMETVKATLTRVFIKQFGELSIGSRS